MPPVPVAGVPLSRPVEVSKVIPEGRVPDSVKVGAGDPVAVTVKLPDVPAVNVAAPALVMAGAWLDEFATVIATVADAFRFPPPTLSAYESTRESAPL